MGAKTQDIQDSARDPPVSNEKDAKGLMVVDLALELHRRAKVFALAGDTLRAKQLIESCIEQMGSAKVSFPHGSRILQLCETLLEAWNTDGVVLQAEENDLVVELERSVSEALRQVTQTPVVAAKLVLGGAGTTPSTSSETTSARGERIALDPKSGGLLNAAAAAAEARIIDDACSGVDWEEGSRISSHQPTPLESPRTSESPPSDLEVATEPVMNLPSSSCRVVEYKSPEPANEPHVKLGEVGGPPGQHGTFELVAAKEVESPVPRKSPGCFFGFCGRKRGTKPGPSKAQCQLRLARDFHRGDLLGAGSYGCVFAARRKTTGEIVAVKEMHLDRAGRTKEERGDRLVRLTRELRLCEQLEDPYIVSYFGHEFVMGAQGGPEKLHLFLEYCSGGSLAAQLRTYGPVNEELLRKYTQHVVSGLVYLHSRSPPVVHRDLKCANLLLTHSGDVKIADFGCSKWVQPGESMLENSVAGSIFWMAPELFRGRGKLTTSSDIWSLGCCVLEMATGCAPWADRRFDNILQACHVIANTEELPTIPIELSTKAAGIIRSCLKRNPLDRPTAQELNKSYKKSQSLCA